MSDIFISYASDDLERIQPLVHALEATGWSVFWDQTIPTGKTWHEFIGEESANCRAMIVVWSQTSVGSYWVKEEALVGRKRGILFPVRIDEVDPPFGFGGIQAANLIGWTGNESFPAYERLVNDLEAKLGQPLAAEAQEQHREEEAAQRQAGKAAESKRKGPAHTGVTSIGSHLMLHKIIPLVGVVAVLLAIAVIIGQKVRGPEPPFQQFPDTWPIVSEQELMRSQRNPEVGPVLYFPATVEIISAPTMVPRNSNMNYEYSPGLEIGYNGLTENKIYTLKIWLLERGHWRCASTQYCEKVISIDNTSGNSSEGVLYLNDTIDIDDYPTLDWLVKLYDSSTHLAMDEIYATGIANRSPKLNPIGEMITELGNTLEFTITATDPDGDQLSFEAANLPSGAEFDQVTGLFIWTPATSGVYHNIKFWVIDDGEGDLYDTELISITVNPGSLSLESTGNRKV